MNILITLALGLTLARLGLAISRHFGILDDPRRAKVYKRDRIPTAQGATLMIAFAAAIAATIPYFSYNPYIGFLLLGSVAFVLMALIDEYIGIPATFRLLLQIIIVGLVIWFGGLDTELLQLGSYKMEFGRARGTAISIVWFVLCINAFNLFDGIEGQTSGVAAIGYFTIRALISRIIIPQFPDITADNALVLQTVQHVSIILLILSLIYSYLESKKLCLLRDAGTYFYGFTIAYLSLLGGAKVGTMVVVLSLVIFDALRVVFYRLAIMKKNPFKGDFTHIHHRLLALGRSRSEVRMFVRIRSASMVILMLLQGSNSINKMIIFAMMATIFFGINIYLYLIKKLSPVYKLDQRVIEILKDPIYKK